MGLFEYKYEVEVGNKGANDMLRRLDLGFNTEQDGIIETKLICTLSSSSKISEELIEKHKKGLRESLGEDYFIGRINLIK